MQIWVLIVTAVLAASVAGVAVRDFRNSAQGSGRSSISPAFVVLLIGLTIFCLVVPDDRTSLVAGMIAIVVVAPAVVFTQIKAMNRRGPTEQAGRPVRPDGGR